MKPLHKLRRAYQRVVINSKRKTQIDTIRGGTFEKEALQLCRNLIRCNNVKLEFFPTSKDRFISLNEMQMKAVIKDDQIIFSNHTYHYGVPISEHNIKTITRIFDGNIERRRLSIETEISDNTKGTLENLLNISNYLKQI